jgi:DNA-binding transcriptional LysR family regulator
VTLSIWRTFVEVCATGSFSAAADSLGYTQSAVSRQVATLEREIGAQLLLRGARGVRPTVAGTALLPHARLVVSEAERGARAATTARPGRHVALGAVPSAAIGLVPEALRRLSEPLSWTMLTELTDRLLALVAEDTLDLAVITDAPPGLPNLAGLRIQHLFDDPMAVAVPVDHRLARRHRVRIVELADEQWIEDNRGSQALLQELAARHGVALRVERSSFDLMTKIALVAAGHGIALVPSILAPALRPDVRLVKLTAAPHRGFHAVRRLDRDDLDELIAALHRAPSRSR